MKTLICAGFALGAACLLAPAPVTEQTSLDSHLEPLRPFLGKTWRGEFKGSTPEKPKFDVSRWERVLNGTTVRVVHSVNDGVYGGESIIFWDRAREKLSYYYFTTAGFYTTGTMTIEDKKLVSRETVIGSSDGTTEVKATSELRADGTLQSKSEYLKNGQWVPGHEVVYHEDPKAEVKFK